MAELTKEQIAAREVSAQAKRDARTKETIEIALDNLGRRRTGHNAEKKLIEDATRDCVVAAHAFGYTYEVISARLNISTQRVGQLLGGRAKTEPARKAEAVEAARRAAKVAKKLASTNTADGLVPAVSDL